jgi:glycosyltransferase involved in cell wall biosynthesis
MKLIVTIPAFNEENTIDKVIKEIPRQIDYIDSVEVLVINDGSTDNTVEVAQHAGADYIITLKKNRGLAFAFRTGLETAVKLNADIIVNTDADFQYNQQQIPDLVKPIIDGKADIVLGSRFRGHIEHMVLQKKIGNKIASWITRKASGYPVSDAQTGFRAFTRDAALRMNILSDYTYVQETILQAVKYNLTIVEIPIDFRKRIGDSRLMSGIFYYAKRAGSTIFRTYRDYEPLKVFTTIGLFFIIVGAAAGIRVLIHYLITGMVSPYLPTAILTTIMWIMGLQIIVFGLIADMLKTQRSIQEEMLYRLKKTEINYLQSQPIIDPHEAKRYAWNNLPNGSTSDICSLWLRY